MLSEKVGRLELEIWKSASRLETTNVDADDRSALKNAILRTCLEIHETDPSLNSGMYWIDPDGIGVGDGAIYVYCDMTSGKALKNCFSIEFDCLKFYFNRVIFARFHIHSTR